MKPKHLLFFGFLLFIIGCLLTHWSKEHDYSESTRLLTYKTTKESNSWSEKLHDSLYPDLKYETVQNCFLVVKTPTGIDTLYSLLNLNPINIKQILEAHFSDLRLFCLEDKKNNNWQLLLPHQVGIQTIHYSKKGKHLEAVGILIDGTKSKISVGSQELIAKYNPPKIQEL